MKLLVWSICALASGCGRVGFDRIAPPPDGIAPSPDGTGPVIPVGAVLWLQMETEPTVEIVDSATGHSVSCSPPSCPTLVSDDRGRGGADDHGYNFQGQQIRVTYRDDLAASNGFTVAAWVRLESYPGDYACSFCKPLGKDDADSYCMCIDRVTSRVYFYSGDPKGHEDRALGTSFTLGTWHHLAMTWDSHTMTKTGYVDGCSIVTEEQIAIESDDNGLVIGADMTASVASYFWDGLIDEVLAYPRVLSSSEIAQLAEVPSACAPGT